MTNKARTLRDCKTESFSRTRDFNIDSNNTLRSTMWHYLIATKGLLHRTIQITAVLQTLNVYKWTKCFPMVMLVIQLPSTLMWQTKSLKSFCHWLIDYIHFSFLCKLTSWHNQVWHVKFPGISNVTILIEKWNPVQSSQSEHIWCIIHNLRPILES